MVNRKIDLIRNALGFEEFAKGDELIYFCKRPTGCAGKHHKAKLSVNTKTDNFHCWVCGWKGQTLVRLFKEMGFRDLAETYCDEFLLFGKSKKHSQEIFVKPQLPDNFRSLSQRYDCTQYRAATNYLKGRGLKSEDILKYKLGYCTEGPYKYRVVIPSFDEGGELNFFVGRSYFDSERSYKHEPYSKDIIFNDYLVDWSHPVMLVEGPFDAFIAGENAIALQGSELNSCSKLLKKIVLSDVPVYLALDSDAWKKQMKIARMLMAYGVEIRNVDVVSTGKKDVGSMSRDEFKNICDRAIYLRSDLDMLRLRVSSCFE
jgi:DNA primase